MVVPLPSVRQSHSLLRQFFIRGVRGMKTELNNVTIFPFKGKASLHEQRASMISHDLLDHIKTRLDKLKESDRKTSSKSIINELSVMCRWVFTSFFAIFTSISCGVTPMPDNTSYLIICMVCIFFGTMAAILWFVTFRSESEHISEIDEIKKVIDEAQK